MFTLQKLNQTKRDPKWNSYGIFESKDVIKLKVNFDKGVKSGPREEKVNFSNEPALT